MEYIYGEHLRFPILPQKRYGYLIIHQKNQMVGMEITNMYSKNLKNQNVKATEGINSFEINTSALQDGLYVLSMISNGKKESTTIMIKK